MLKRQINIYIGALLITVIGACATFTITRVAAETHSFVYTDTYFAPTGGAE